MVCDNKRKPEGWLLGEELIDGAVEGTKVGWPGIFGVDDGIMLGARLEI